MHAETHLMLAAGGIVFGNYRHAAEVCPQLWANWEAAKKAFARYQKGTNPYENILHTGMSPSGQPLRRLDYQRAGERHSAAIAWFDPLLCPDPEAFLTDKLGPLAWCRPAAAEPSLADPIVSPAVAKAAHAASKPLPAKEPLTMPANDERRPAARIEPLRPDEVYPPMKPRSPIMPIEGLWRVTMGEGPPRVIITSPEPLVTIHGRATTPFPPFCRGHFAPLAASQEASP